MTADALRNGWYHTGVVGYMDEGGYVFIVDRSPAAYKLPNGGIKFTTELPCTSRGKVDKKVLKGD
jgi:hypothetical protein